MTASNPHRHIKKRLMKTVEAHTPCSCVYSDKQTDADNVSHEIIYIKDEQNQPVVRYFGIRKKPATHINKRGGWFGMKN